jgi:transcriptional regulator with XRE-family HTH domain
MQRRSTASISNQSDAFGMLLKHWRNQRGYSQLDLALTSQVSQRHISFLESGRAKPSQEMIIQLASVLEIPLRQQNRMLTAAGFAPIHTETDLSAPEMTPICKALNLILQQQEPLPAFVVDRYWNLLLSNNGATQLLTTFVDSEKLQTLFKVDGKINLMRVVFHSQGLRPFMVNWQEAVNHLLQRLDREVKAYGSALPNPEGETEQFTALFNELMSYPGVPEIWQTSNGTAENALLLPLHLKREHLELQFFSTIATLGTPYDITLQELRIECLFPADETTERNWKNSIT